jgi:hypothetical protein
MRPQRDVWLVTLLLFALAVPAGAQPAQCPNPAPNPPPVNISWQFPSDVCPAPPPDPGILFFDDFSWRSFVALIWPSVSGQRGVPDRTGTPGGTGTPVFQTYKADWEVFLPNGREPSAWSSYNVAGVPCGATVPPAGSLVLASYSKFGNVRLAGVGTMMGPLISQNVQYTRFQAAFNQVSFDDILNGKWYLQSGLINNITFKPDAAQNNPIDIKSSWVIMTPGMNASRFYTTRAYVFNTDTNKCDVQTVGLVGLHIVTKTPTRPQWIWSTFEQVDNIPQAGAQRPYTYNDGGGAKMPAKNPISSPTAKPCVPAPSGVPCPFNVDRLQPIDPSTMRTNGNYQRALASRGSGVWQYYQLVMTQWPTPGSSPGMNGGPAHTIPGNIPTPFAGPMTSFANVTMETFDQAKITGGCMNCHNSAAADSGASTDFNWAVPMNAYSNDHLQLGTASLFQLHALTKATAKPPSAAIQKLIAIMAQAQKDMEASPKTAKTPEKKPAKTKAKTNSSK